MSQVDSVMKIYAVNGLRTVEDWVLLGRAITLGSKPRVDASFRGELMPLFSRDQTFTRPKTKRERD